MVWVQETFAELHRFEQTIVRVGDQTLKTAVARTPEQKALGMTGRGYDGWDAMLFVQDRPDPATFHNAGVPQATHVATFDMDGCLVEQFTMASNDPQRVVVLPHKFALETHGDTADFSPGLRLVLT